MYYIWFKPIGGLQGLEMKFCMELSQPPLLYMKIILQLKGILLSTLPCFGSCTYLTIIIYKKCTSNIVE